MEDQYHMEDSVSSSYKEEEEEEHTPYFQADTKKETTKSDQKFPCHQAFHVINAMS